jgi:inorganic pyrophosphatase
MDHSPAATPRALGQLDAIDADSGLVNVVIDTPRGSRCKYKYDEKAGVFRLGKLLPLGATFPYDFGFVPSTRGEDGDAVDVLVLLDEPVFVGCVVPVRLIGVLEAEQTEQSGETVRNDRLLGVVETPYNPPEVRSLDELHKQRVDEIEHFFTSYNEMEGRKFRPTGRRGPDRAERLLEEGRRRAAEETGKKDKARGKKAAAPRKG